METVKSRLPVGSKIFSIILGAVMGGFMWRCRGEGGFGSSWGLYSVGLVFMLLIYHFYADRKGMKYEMIPIGALMLGLSVTGYGTVIEQMSGCLWSDLPYSGPYLYGAQEPVVAGPYGDVYVPIDPESGAIIIFLMAFTLLPLFSFFVTSLFSDKEYKIKDYIIVIALFFVASTVFKASISHFIVKAINPDQVQYAAFGLKAYGHDYSSPMAAYMSHFLDRGWSQEIPFFENYYMSVEHVSDTLAVLVISFYALLVRKDSVTGIGSFVIDLLTAIPATALTTLVWARIPAFCSGIKFPKLFLTFADWGVWEYSVGFFAGLFIMIFVALASDKFTCRSGADDTPLIADKKINFFFSFALTVFIFGVVPARVIALRLCGLLKNLHILPDDEPFGTILLVVLAIVFGIFMIKPMRTNILEKGSNAFDMAPEKFARIALPSYLVMCFIVYFFLDDVLILRFKSDITCPLMLVTSAVIAVLYVPYLLSGKKKQR